MGMKKTKSRRADVRHDEGGDQEQDIPTLASLPPSSERIPDAGTEIDRNDLREALESTIRQRAYEIWQEENCPDGRAEEHWARAERETLANSRSLRESVSRS
jgi:hypothetical protein